MFFVLLLNFLDFKFTFFFTKLYYIHQRGGIHKLEFFGPLKEKLI